jgi:hypothetical protein
MVLRAERSSALQIRRFVAGLAAILAPALALPFELSVQGSDLLPVNGFRYLVEEDNTLPVVPGLHTDAIPSLQIRNSHAPVVASGRVAGSTAIVDVPDVSKRYLVSVMPDAGGTISGAPVEPGQAMVSVVVPVHPLPTAQFSIYTFQDDSPINGAPDIPAEAALPDCSVLVFDPLGQVTADAFGNLLGTQYLTDPSGSPILDADGAPIPTVMGDGTITTDANGEAFVRYLAPGKYGVRALPPAVPDGEPEWVQTTTIEGTPTVDAWVRSGEPPFFQEWGFFMWHVFHGFVRPKAFPAPVADPVTGVVPPTGTITGRMTFVHDRRPPLMAGTVSGRPVPDCYVGLSDLGAADNQVFTAKCAPDSTFTIPDVPPGNYMLTLWDLPLDAIIDFRVLTVPDSGGPVALGDVPVFDWFGRIQGSVFADVNGNGVRDLDATGALEPGLSDKVINIRYPDGSIYQSTATDMMGEYEMPEVFPFFFWLVAESDLGGLEATGMTTVIDEGGDLPFPGAEYTPQLQADGLPYRTENNAVDGGESLLSAFKVYEGQTNVMDWGKRTYGPAKGIYGSVIYQTTRGENDPQLAAADPWEPGVPRVQVNLYRDAPDLANGTLPDGKPDDVNGVAGFQPPDQDNYPLGNFPGPEDVDHDGNTQFDGGDAINVVWTDSWDDSKPTECPGGPQVYGDVAAVDCAETIRTWNQVRPGVFDGGYGFRTSFDKGFGNPESAEVGLASGGYVVEVIPPPGYQIQKEEDKNVDFGDAYVPAQAMAGIGLVSPECVGAPHLVPAELALFPGVPVDPAFAGKERPLCDRKKVHVGGSYALSDFHVFTEVPKAARIWGMVLNDVLLEFNQQSPLMGTNFGAQWLPISIRDFTGRELVRTYTDEWGKYNAIVPSTYTINAPIPTGVAPNVLTICLNDPGTIDPLTGVFVPDPNYNPRYGQVCTNWDFWPGKTTRLDTPILPIGAFAANQIPIDCEYADGTPLVKVATTNGAGGAVGNGPYVPAPGATNAILTLRSVGAASVPNPGFDPATPGSPRAITRDFGFGTGGTVSLALNGGTTLPLQVLSWQPGEITAFVPAVPARTHSGQLLVTRSDTGLTSPIAVSVHLSPQAVIRVGQPGATTIQAAIDLAPENAIVMVPPGTYREAVIMWKKVKLQGYGAFSTTILAGPRTPAEEAAWSARMIELETQGRIDLLPGERPDFFLENGAGILVATRTNGFSGGGPNLAPARIDGLSVRGATQGGGIFVHAYAHNLRITNDRIEANEGNFGGGIRLGVPSLVNGQGNGYESSENTGVVVQYDQVIFNGAISGGGGFAIFNGATNYRVTDNLVCGNYSNLYGGGIAHYGLSDGGLIARNDVLSNQSFDEGGGVMLGGELVPATAPAGTLTQGTGSVTLDSNLIQGNLSGDDGGGVRVLMANGDDVASHRNQPDQWHRLLFVNNLIANNASSDAGGAISLDDAARVVIANNTIAHNDSTATGVDAFGGPCIDNPPVSYCLGPEAGNSGGLVNSVPQPAGIHSRVHSAGLQAAFAPGNVQTYSKPVLEENVIWQNRAFYWDALGNGGTGALVFSTVWDLGVTPITANLLQDPQRSILTDATGYAATNFSADPLFAYPYVNAYSATSKGNAFGNFVVVTWEQVGPRGDYHVTSGSPAVGAGVGLLIPTTPELRHDFDQQPRPDPTTLIPDVGADERQ